MWIKICGVTLVEDAAMIATAGADAIGLNFYPRSRRFIDVRQAVEIRERVGDALDIVGVFVNSSLAEITEVCRQTALTAVQFHGDESATEIAAFHQASPGTAIIRAFRVGPAGTADVDAALLELTAAEVPLAAVLVDALVAGEYGGTGHLLDPELLQHRSQDWPRLVLAGGLNPDTVADAVDRVQPWGVDTASGVETRPGVKCPLKVRQFVSALRSAAEPQQRLN
ncbi:MAG: phosphoribosylanthranilate isomerase [Fuerstiella sp.]